MTNAIETQIDPMISAIVKGIASEFPMRTHAELDMFTLERIAANMGCTKPNNQPKVTLRTVCVVVKPYLWNGCNTI